MFVPRNMYFISGLVNKSHSSVLSQQNVALAQHMLIIWLIIHKLISTCDIRGSRYVYFILIFGFLSFRRELHVLLDIGSEMYCNIYLSLLCLQVYFTNPNWCNLLVAYSGSFLSFRRELRVLLDIGSDVYCNKLFCLQAYFTNPDWCNLLVAYSGSFTFVNFSYILLAHLSL